MGQAPDRTLLDRASANRITDGCATLFSDLLVCQHPLAGVPQARALIGLVGDDWPMSVIERQNAGAPVPVEGIRSQSYCSHLIVADVHLLGIAPGVFDAP
jgi:hypothetical protein